MTSLASLLSILSIVDNPNNFLLLFIPKRRKVFIIVRCVVCNSATRCSISPNCSRSVISSILLLLLLLLLNERFEEILDLLSINFIPETILLFVFVSCRDSLVFAI